MIRSLNYLSLFFCASSFPLSAEVIYVDHSATGANSGSTWVDAYTDLNSALSAGRHDDEIWVAQGTYKPGTTVSSRFYLSWRYTILGGFAGGESSSDTRDPESNITVLSGDIGVVGDMSDNCYHVLYTGPGNEATVDGFTIQGGNASSTGINGRGGGIEVYNESTTTFRNLRIFGNSANLHGGGVYCDFLSKPLFEDCLFLGNQASLGGGAVAVAGSSDPEFVRCTFRSNTTPAWGGAIINPNLSGQMTIRDSLFVGNTSTRTGGAIYFLGDGLLSVSGTTFRGNETPARAGGMSTTSGTVVIYNCDFQGNKGAGLVVSEALSLNITNCSFQGNDLRGLSVGDSPGLIANTVIWGNSVSGSTDGLSSSYLVGGTPIPSLSNCLIQNVAASSPGNLNGTNPGNDPLFVGAVDPLRAPVQSGNLALKEGSPLLDRGSDDIDLDGAGPMTLLSGAVSFDVAGEARKQGTRIDIGAHEGTLEINFAALFPGLGRDDDANGNGLSNLADYGLGVDPTLFDNGSAHPRLFRNGGELFAAFSQRRDAPNLVVTYQRTTTLGSNNWTAMVAGVDYHEVSRVNMGPDRVVVNLQLLFETTDRGYLRQMFNE